jgi:ADP-ribose pyrophosphatase YjhB (NUDIX family)
MMERGRNGSEKTIGVALILRNWHGKVLVLREKQTKLELGKMAGMYSIPMETVKILEGETPREAVERMIREEVPCFDKHVEFAPDWERAYRARRGIWVLLYTGFTWRVDTPILTKPSDEVDDHRWMFPQDILKLWTRKGVREMIMDRYFSDRERRICRRCVDPPLEDPRT